MVSADSHRIPRAPCYSGTPSRRPTGFAYGALTHYGPPSQEVRLPTGFLTAPRHGSNGNNDAPQPHDRNPCRVYTRPWFNHHPLSLATTHGISSPAGTEMFHFPASPLAPYTTSDTSDTPQRVPGLPIRTPSDHSPSAGSPRLIAGHHVLHRPLMPRHPPNAHKNKQTQQTKSKRTQQRRPQRQLEKQTKSHTRPHTPDKPEHRAAFDARAHYAVHNQPTHTPTQPPPPKKTRGKQRGSQYGAGPTLGAACRPRAPIACHARITPPGPQPPTTRREHQPGAMNSP